MRGEKPRHLAREPGSLLCRCSGTSLWPLLLQTFVTPRVGWTDRRNSGFPATGLAARGRQGGFSDEFSPCFQHPALLPSPLPSPLCGSLSPDSTSSSITRFSSSAESSLARWFTPKHLEVHVLQFLRNGCTGFSKHFRQRIRQKGSNLRDNF